MNVGFANFHAQIHRKQIKRKLVKHVMIVFDRYNNLLDISEAGKKGWNVNNC